MSIKSEMINGVYWSAIQKYSGFFVQLIVSAVLARLLSPEDFGVIAISTVIIAFFSLFTDMGIGAAIVQNRNLTKDDLNSLFSLGIYMGLFLAVLFCVLSYPIALMYENYTLLPICLLLSINLLFASWNIVPNALINKEKRFKFIAKRTLALQVVCGIVSVLAAYHGAGVYALVISPIVTSMGVFVWNYIQYDLHFMVKVNMVSVKKILSFSLYQFLFGFINYFSRNLDKLIMGRYYSMGDLGYYEKSYRLMTLPLGYVTNVITPVMHPILSSLQDDYASLADKHNKIIRILAVLSFPIGVFLYFSAKNIIMVVYGSQWVQAVPVFEILALSLPLQMILSSIGAIYQAAGKTNWLFYGGISNTMITVTGFILATVFYRTIDAMAWAWDITLVLNMIVSYVILYRFVLKSPLLVFAKQFVWPFVSAIVLAVLLNILSLIGCRNMLLEIVMQGASCMGTIIIFAQISGSVDVIKLVGTVLKR